MKTLPITAPDVKVEDGQDIISLLSETINHVRKGLLDPRVANAIGYLVNILLKAEEQGGMESRLTQLEALVKARDNAAPTFCLTSPAFEDS